MSACFYPLPQSAKKALRCIIAEARCSSLAREQPCLVCLSEAQIADYLYLNQRLINFYASAGDVRQRMREQGVLSGAGAEKKPAPEIPEDVPRALHRFYKRGTQ